MRQKAAKNVDEYLEALPALQRTTLEKIRKTIRSIIPKAEEVISYQIPIYKLNGPVAAFAAYENHCSFYTMSQAIMNAFREELKNYDASGVTIRFPIGKPLPATLLKKLIHAKLKENEARIAARKLARSKK